MRRRSSSAVRLGERWCWHAWRSSTQAASSTVPGGGAGAERRGEASCRRKRGRVEWSGTARTSRRASVLSGIWRQEVTILFSQWEEGEKLCTNDEWAPQEFPFSDFTNMDSGFWLRKNSYKDNKNPRKYGVVGNPIWNTFHYCNFFQISTIFELIKRF
jgi:hypothetical protein